MTTVRVKDQTKVIAILEDSTIKIDGETPIVSVTETEILTVDVLEVGPQGPGTDLGYDTATRLLTSSTGADVTLPLFSTTYAGFTPTSPGGTTSYLRADGTWFSPFTGFRDSRRVYVSIEGNDSNNGTSLGEPLRTLAAAAAAAQSGDVVVIAPGTYVEAALPIRWKRDVGIMAASLRNAIVRPAAGQEYNNLFHVDSGFWCWGLQFAGHQANSASGLQAWAIAFDPLADNTAIGAIGLGAYILQSPYIQNCSSITAEDDAGLAGSQSTGDTGGGILVDGTKCAPNSPIRSMVVDSYTQVNLGGPGCLVKNDGYAQLVSFFGTFCQYHVRTESGGQVNLSGGGTSDFGTYGLMADGYSPSPIFTGAARVATFGATRIEKAVTIAPSTDTFTATTHTLAVNDQVTFSVSNGTLPSPLATGTTYYVIASGLTANAFKVSLTEGGAALDITGSATGTYQVIRQGALAVDVISLTANRLSRQIKYPTAGSLGSPGYAVNISAISGSSFTVTLGTVAGISHTYTGGGTVTVGATTYPVTAATYNNATGVTTVTATGYTPTVGASVTLSGLSFICNSASRPTAGQLMFPQLVFPRNSSTGAPEAKTFAFTRTGTYSLTFTEAASPSGPEHEYVSGGTAVVGATNLGVAAATYNKSTGVVTLTTVTAVPAASGNVTVDGLAFICPTSAYIVSSSVPINSAGTEVANSDPTKAGYRVNFYNAVNGGLINKLTAGQLLDFRNRSQISAPGHTFEYVGSGTNYDALPFNGGVPIPGNKIVETNNGRIYSSNTDELGNFAVGSQFSVDGTTGSVTITTDQFNLSGLNFIGPFSRNGGFSTVGVQLQEVSNNTSLIASTGAADANTAPTQFAVKEYVGSRYVSNVTATAGQPITLTGTAAADGSGNWTFVRNIDLSLNTANGLAQLDASTLLPRALLPDATTSAKGALTAADKTKLDGIAAGATANQTDAYLLARANHTGTQAAATITGLASVATSGAYADLSGRPTLGTAAPLDVAAAGDATSAQVVKGNDSRLSDARTPTAHTQAASTISDSTTAGRALLTAVDAPAQRTALGLGTASTQNVGTAAGNVVQLDGAAKLPAVDGSQLTGLPLGITDLGYVAATRLLTSSTGADVNLPLFTSTDAGLTPSSGGGTSTFLRADGTWAAPIASGAEVLTIAVRNDTASSIAKGTPVYLTGSNGTVLTIAPADASTEATAALTIGVVQNTIGSNSNGYVLAVGELSGLDTSALTAGALIWLSETTGQLTSTRPTQPAHGVVVGYCVKSGGGTSGIIYVKVDNGLELNELHDVLIATPLTDQALVLAADGLWKNRTIYASTTPAGLGTAAVGVSTTLARSDHVHANPTASQITDSTTAGRALLTAADAAAQRTALALGGAATLNVGTTAGTVAAGNDSRFITAKVDATTSQLIYTGQAPSGSAEGAAVWTIVKTTYSTAGLRLTLGTATNVTWTGRASHTYT